MLHSTAFTLALRDAAQHMTQHSAAQLSHLPSPPSLSLPPHPPLPSPSPALLPPRPDLLLVLLPSRCPSLYQEVKVASDAALGVPSQVLVAPVAGVGQGAQPRGRLQYCNNLGRGLRGVCREYCCEYMHWRGCRAAAFGVCMFFCVYGCGQY
jgi:hypothetical protein